MKGRTRVLVAILLLTLMFLMGVHYDSASGNHRPYPTTDDLGKEYEQYIGNRILLFGTVEEINEQAQTGRIHVDYSGGSFIMTVHDFTADVRPGGIVQVLGTLRPDHVIVADSIVVVNPTGASNLYKYTVSLVGVLMIVLLFFRYWRINTEKLIFEAR